jgi:hypothetical protein
MEFWGVAFGKALPPESILAIALCLRPLLISASDSWSHPADRGKHMRQQSVRIVADVVAARHSDLARVRDR